MQRFQNIPQYHTILYSLAITVITITEVKDHVHSDYMTICESFHSV